MNKAKKEELELLQLLCFLKLPLERAIEDVGLYDSSLPKNTTVSWTTSIDTIEGLLDHIKRLSVVIGSEYEFKDKLGGIKKGVLHHKTSGGRFYIDAPGRKTAHVCEWQDGGFVERQD